MKNYEPHVNGKVYIDNSGLNVKVLFKSEYEELKHEKWWQKKLKWIREV